MSENLTTAIAEASNLPITFVDAKIGSCLVVTTDNYEVSLLLRPDGAILLCQTPKAMTMTQYRQDLTFTGEDTP